MTWRQQAASDGPWSHPDARTSPRRELAAVRAIASLRASCGLRHWPPWPVGIAASITGTPLAGRGRFLIARPAEFDLMFVARRGLMSAGLAGPLDLPAAAAGHGP
jgi:hypothetical protein